MFINKIIEQKLKTSNVTLISANTIAKIKNELAETYNEYTTLVNTPLAFDEWCDTSSHALAIINKHIGQQFPIQQRILKIGKDNDATGPELYTILVPEVRKKELQNAIYKTAFSEKIQENIDINSINQQFCTYYPEEQAFSVEEIAYFLKEKTKSSFQKPLEWLKNYWGFSCKKIWSQDFYVELSESRVY